MPVPDYQSLMLPVLRALADVAETPISEVRKGVAKAEALTPDSLREMLPGGSRTVFVDRVHWAMQYMGRANLVERIRRGVYRLTAEGKRLLAQTPARVDQHHRVFDKESGKLSDSEGVWYGLGT